MPKRKAYCFHNCQEEERKIPHRTRTRWKQRKIEKYLHDLEAETFQSGTNDNVSQSPNGNEESTPTDTGLQDNILLQPETTRESPSIEKKDMSHIPERKVQSQSPNTNDNLPLRTGQSISNEIQDDSPMSHSPETTEEGTSSEVQDDSPMSHSPETAEEGTSSEVQSAFMFENYNGYLLKQVKSSNAVPQQICKRVAWSRALPRIAKACLSDDVSPEMKSFYTDMASSKHHMSPGPLLADTITE
ncbi:hypothetical protein ROHU_001192 [Labeo rohita]|uniref:Uncharacterized protein n=1 Tax=Labeo rohita TaxID=84645 RepID=A0A498P362_LABRO|nr:hypothetical protein ROHU_001192 [Labeo rohita]